MQYDTIMQILVANVTGLRFKFDTALLLGFRDVAKLLRYSSLNNGHFIGNFARDRQTVQYWILIGSEFDMYSRFVKEPNIR